METKQSNKAAHIIYVKKTSGEVEPFNVSKLERSLKNAGAGIEVVKEIVSDIDGWIFTGVTTKQIYSRAFQMLRQKEVLISIYYKLKQAIMELGPTGYPFETFIGKIFEKQGYRVEVGQILDGYCITHEMDVIATNDTIQHLVECKYRTTREKTIAIQVPLYVKARVDDIIKKRQDSSEFKGLSFQGWVVTNNRFSSESIDYAKCSGLNLIAWDYPLGKGLKDIIEKEKLYPLTLLTKLTKKDKQELLNRGIVLCDQLLDKPELLEPFQLTRPKHKAVMKELMDIIA